MIETLKREVDAMNLLTTIYAEEPTAASGSHFERGLSFSKAQVRDMQAAITNLRALITQLEKQEPVAYLPFDFKERLTKDGDAIAFNSQLNYPNIQPHALRTPVFTHPAPAVPDGWKLVPIEPTEDMARAGMCYALTIETYKAMLSAAPEYKRTREMTRLTELKKMADAALVIGHNENADRCSEEAIRPLVMQFAGMVSLNPEWCKDNEPTENILRACMNKYQGAMYLIKQGVRNLENK